jgi:hypothetical protein
VEQYKRKREPPVLAWDARDRADQTPTATLLLFVGKRMLWASSTGTPAKKRTIPHSTLLLSYLRGSLQLRDWGHFDSHKDGIFLFKKLWHLWHFLQKATNATNATNATKMPQMPQMPQIPQIPQTPDSIFSPVN